MDDMAVCTISGRLTRDAELSYTSSNLAIMKLSIVANKSCKVNGQWESKPHYYDAVMFGKRAESLNQYCKKGKEVLVAGELDQDRWEKDGQKRSKHTVKCSFLKLTGGRSSENQQSNSPQQNNSAPQKEERFEDDVPF